MKQNKLKKIIKKYKYSIKLMPLIILRNKNLKKYDLVETRFNLKQ